MSSGGFDFAAVAAAVPATPPSPQTMALPSLSPYGLAALERVATDDFLLALGDYRAEVRRANEFQETSSHERVARAYQLLRKARSRAGKLTSFKNCVALEIAAS